MPKKLEILGIAAQLDPAQANIKPRLVYVEDSQFPQRVEVTYLLLRGQATVDAPGCKNFEFVAMTYDQNRRHNGIATLWQVDQVKDVVIEKPVVKPKHVELPSPESLAAIKAHEEKLQVEKERLQNLKQFEEVNEEFPSTEAEKEYFLQAEIEEAKNPLIEALEENFGPKVDFLPKIKNEEEAAESARAIFNDDAFAGLEEDADMDELDNAKS